MVGVLKTHLVAMCISFVYTPITPNDFSSVFPQD